MDNEVNYTIVGAFVIALITAIVITIIWLSSGLSRSSLNSNYYIYSNESVSGLNIDAPVEYNGVNVGTVKQISLDPQNPRIVKVLISIQRATQITHGTIATLTTRGITGVVFISLKDTGKDLRPLKVVGNEAYPIIPTTPSLFMRLDIALTRITNNLDTVSKAFNALLDKHNLESISETLDSLRTITAGLAGSSSNLSSIIKNTEIASHQFGPTLKDTQNTVKSLEAQTLPSIYELTNTMNNLMKTLTGVSEQLNQNPSVIMRGTSPPPLGPGEVRR